jgi:hypothetical protein
MSWLLRMTAAPPFASRRARSRTSRAPPGSSELVEDQPRGPQQHSRKAEALAHAGRVGFHPLVRLPDETDLRERAVDAVAAAASVAAIEPREQPEVPSSGQVRIERGRLHEAGNSPRYGAGRRLEAGAEKFDGAGVATDESEQNAYQRALAGAVRAEEAVQLTGPRDQIHAAESFAPSVALRHASGLHGGMHGQSRDDERAVLPGACDGVTTAV